MGFNQADVLITAGSLITEVAYQCTVSTEEETEQTALSLQQGQPWAVQQCLVGQFYDRQCITWTSREFS